MRPTLTARSVRGPAGAFLALLACALVGPSRVEAGCAHPGIAGPGREAMVRLIDGLAVAAAGSSRVLPDGTAPIAPEGSPRPCSGPSCSGSPAAPSVPTIGPVPHDEPKASLGSTTPPPPSPRPSYLVPDPCVPIPIRHGDGIFHPPRATSPPSPTS